MSKAAQGFSPEAYLRYVEGGNLQRTTLIGKIAIYGWKPVRVRAIKKSPDRIKSIRGFPFFILKI
jgi:hypothetical protein